MGNQSKCNSMQCIPVKQINESPVKRKTKECDKMAVMTGVLMMDVMMMEL